MQEQYDRHIMTAVKKKLKEADIHKNMGQVQKIREYVDPAGSV